MMMIGYASRTGTKKNLRALRKAKWRLVVSARGVLRTEGFPYGLDNGAWTAFQKGQPFDEDAFKRALDLLGEEADWIVVPDIVAGGRRSLDYSEGWLDRVPSRLRLLAVQDGMEPEHVRPLLEEHASDLGIFIGGTTEWKETRMKDWGELAEDVDCYLHVGRVNTRRRIKLCGEAGADSFDGTSATRFVKTLPLLEQARKDFSR